MTFCQKPDAKLFELSNIPRDENPADVDVPSSCWVLDSEGWAIVLKDDSFFAGILMRNEYREATNAAFSFFKGQASRFLTNSDEEASGDKPLRDNILQVPFENPFLRLSIEETSVRTGVIFLGHPGIGE